MSGWIYNILTGRRRKRRLDDIEPKDTSSRDYCVPEVRSRSTPALPKKLVKHPRVSTARTK